MDPAAPAIAITSAPRTQDRAAALRAGLEADYPKLRRTVRNLVRTTGVAGGGNPEEVTDEVLQDAVARALAKTESYDPTRPARPWVTGFAVKILKERQRAATKSASRTVAAGRTDAGDEAPDPVDLLPSLDDVYELATQPQRLAELLGLVPPAERQLLRLRFVEDLDNREIAAVLGIKPVAARVRLHRALDRLRTVYLDRQSRTGER
jgi:RNA polymerase sigma factor (sigma-70 family)